MGISTDQLVHAFLMALAHNDHHALGQICADQYHGETVDAPAQHRGVQGLLTHRARYVQAFPDLHVRITDSAVAPEQAVLHWHASGTHQAPFIGIPATGRRVDIKGILWIHIQHQQIAQTKTIWDVAGFLRTLGLLPKLRPIRDRSQSPNLNPHIH